MNQSGNNNQEHYGAAGETQPEDWVRVSEEMDQNQPSYRIVTSRATYLIHKTSGGMASLIDKDGKDWISYRDLGGSDGSYRGIPNLRFPEGYFHPGKENARSQIIRSDPDCCCIQTATLDGVCEATWEFYAHYAIFKLIKAPQRYWFLYEGTPAGELNEKNGYITRPGGIQTSSSAPWEGILAPGWLYFGSSVSSKVLFIALNDVEPCFASYWPMEGRMTVFGFGRRGMEHLLNKHPATFLVGLTEANGYENIRHHIESILSEINTRDRTGGNTWPLKEK